MNNKKPNTPALQHPNAPLPRLTNPSVIKELLNNLGHRPNKGLGQNYLIDGNIIGIIVNAAEISTDDRLLEIGPGLGALTQALVATGAPLLAIEKDATMAHFILTNRLAGHVLLHINGAYHSDFFEGILWYLKQKNADLGYLTITTVEQDDIRKLQAENLGRADFIICVDEDMTTTY